MGPVIQGTWPEHCEQRAFVAGAEWWQFHHNGSTMFPSERHDAEQEALRRYGEPPQCAICGDDESADEIETVQCIVCKRIVCEECASWAHDPDDEPCGDWVCRECFQKQSPE